MTMLRHFNTAAFRKGLKIPKIEISVILTATKPATVHKNAYSILADMNAFKIFFSQNLVSKCADDIS